VALTGEGGDGALRERESHLARLLFSGRWVRALSESLAYVRLHRRIPRPGFRRLRVRRRGVPNADYAPAPWIRPEFIERAGLRDRWRALELADRLPDETEVRRPEAYAKLQSVFWQRCAESDHPSSTGIALELRHTYFDERVVNFLLSLPSEQWANDKGIVVAAMRGHLPNRVRLRRKTPLVGDSYDAAFQVGGSPRPNLEHFDELARTYIDPAALPAGGSDTDPDNPWDWTRAYSLALWLKRLGSDGGRSRTATARADVQLAP
jgi:hypothetical protein